MKRKFSLMLVTFLTMSMLTGCGTAKAVSTFAESAAPQAGISDAVQTVVNIKTTQSFSAEAVTESNLETILSAGINAPSAMNGQPWHFSVITEKSVLEEIAGGMSFGGVPSSFGKEKPEGMERPEMAEDMPEGGERPMMPEGTPDGVERPEMPEGMELTGAPDGMQAPPNGQKLPEGGMPNGEKMTPPTGSGAAKAGMADAPLAIVISCKEGSQLDAGLACQNMSVAAQLLGYGTKIISSPTMTLNGSRKAEFDAMLGIPDGMKAVAVLLIGAEDTTTDGVTSATMRNPLNEMVTYVKP